MTKLSGLDQAWSKGCSLLGIPPYSPGLRFSVEGGGADCSGLECHTQDVRLEHGNKRGGPVVAASKGPWPDGSCERSLGWPLATMGPGGKAGGGRLVAITGPKIPFK